jgi:hypothetical protein
MVHIGRKIKKVIYESRVPIGEFASNINKSRTVVYHIFKRETIDTGLLLTISKVLKHNFFTYYTSGKNLLTEPEERYYSKSEIAELHAQIERLRKEKEAALKEIEYLKKINKLLEKK